MSPQELDKAEKKYAGKIVIANYYQLGMEAKQFKTDMRKTLRTGMPVEFSHLATMNSQWQNCGKLYVIDEAATAKFQEDLAAHKENLAKAEEVRAAGAEQLADAITNISKGAAKAKAKTKAELKAEAKAKAEESAAGAEDKEGAE